MAFNFRILNFKFMYILCFDGLGRKYFAIFTVLSIKKDVLEEVSAGRSLQNVH